MGLPYRARVNERWFLNLPGFHGRASEKSVLHDVDFRARLAEPFA